MTGIGRRRVSPRRQFGLLLATAVAVMTVSSAGGVGRADESSVADAALLAKPLAAGDVLRVSVPAAEGGKTVIGQLTVARATDVGFVTAYACGEGLPRDDAGRIDKSDLNYDGRVAGAWSNRLIVEADDDGDVCFSTSGEVEMIVDINATTFDTGITSFASRRTDTRTDDTPLAAGDVLKISVPEAVGGRTVIGQVTAARATDVGFVTAYGCADGLPMADDAISRSDLNYDGRVSPVRSNRLIVAADEDGDVCLRAETGVDLVVDVNGVADTGISSFPNERTDTRLGGEPITAGELLRINIPEAEGSLTVVGQLTAAGVTDAGYVTAYACEDGLPVDDAGFVTRSDLNYDPLLATSLSNRLIVEADANGDVCFFTLASVHLVVDVNGVSGAGITSLPNRRTDTRRSTAPGTRDLPVDESGVPQWPPYEVLGPLDGVAALTGLPSNSDVNNRPIIAVKIDNFRLARPHFGIDQADAILEVNVEGVSRFIALFHSQTPSIVGPTRSARTTDLDLLAAMNRPLFAYSGANFGVTQWLRSAERSGVLEDFGAQRNGCFTRVDGRPGPHNLALSPSCVLDSGRDAGPGRPLWAIDASWAPSEEMGASPDTTFEVAMDGVRVGWTWDSTAERYLRSQDGAPHVVTSGTQLSASTVVELAAVHTASTVDARSPHVVTLGSGNARVHRDGLAIAATWTREFPADRFTFRDAATGEPLPLDEGITFLEFVRDR